MNPYVVPQTAKARFSIKMLPIRPKHTHNIVETPDLA